MRGDITRKQLDATYHAPAEPEPSKDPGPRRVPNGLSISWGNSHAKIRAAMPAAYDVDVNLSDGRRLLNVVSS
jgi:hypothetical protein